MEMTLNEFIEKCNEIEELSIKQISNIGIYNWETIGNNEELNDYIHNKLKKNLKITDAYKIPESDGGWVKKDFIDNIINIIENSENYNEMYIKLNKIENIRAYTSKENDIITKINIQFNNNWDNKIAKLVNDKIQSPKIVSTLLMYDTIDVKHYDLDIKEQCKHSCKTQYKIKEFNKIFNL